MNLNQFYDLLEKIRVTYESNTMNYEVLVLNLIVLTFVICMYYNITIKEIINEKRYIVITLVNIAITFLLQLFLGNIKIFPSLFSFFGINLVIFLKDKELFKIFSKTQQNNNNNTNSDQQQKQNSISAKIVNNTAINKDMNAKMIKLGKTSNFNIIDVLFLYDYISDYQRRKVIQLLLCESTDQMADTLLTTFILTEDELKEAKAILNLIGLEGRIVTKDEAILCLLKNKKGKGEKDD